MKKLSLLLSVLLLLSLLAGCGGKEAPTVTGASLDGENHIILRYSDGSVKDMGAVQPSADPSGTDTPAGGQKKITGITVNEEGHAILTYEDGTTEDFGEAEVNALPPVFTVTFTDADGNVLKTEQVYKGLSATAPNPPSVPDASFDTWDVSFDNVQGDITVKPLYKEAARYTVTFRDADGTVLKTETVIAGHDATAPAEPSSAGKIFDGWDVSFTNVQSDLTVTAVYRTAGSYTVTFKDYSGVVLGTASVKEGDTAKAPVTPTREGYKFTGWSESISNVTKNMTVTAKYTVNAGSNLLDLSAKVSGSDLTVTVSMKGTVKVCGMEGSFKVPAGLTFVSASDGDGTVSNYKDGTVYFMFSSANGKNVTKSFTVTTLKFKIASSAGKSVKLATALSDIYDQNYQKVSSSVLGQEIRLK